MLKNIYHNYIGTHNLQALLRKEIKEGWSVLDIGSGRNSCLAPLEKKGWRVGIDHYLPYLETSRATTCLSRQGRVHDANVQGDVRDLPFKDNSFDCAVATEIIEHMEKEDGLLMLREMERVANKKIILTTPNGFLPTLPGPDDNPDEAHISGWTVEELRELGFTVYGFNGPKALWTLKQGRATLRVVPECLPIVASIVIDIGCSMVYEKPERAFQLFFIKDLAQ